MLKGVRSKQKDQSESTQDLHYLSRRIEPPDYLNTRIEGMFHQRLKKMDAIHYHHKELLTIEHMIALNCCPFYLAQRLWHDDGYKRIPVYVCEIRFHQYSPYYQFWVKVDNGKLISKRMKGNLAYLSGIQNTFIEDIEAYSNRLRSMVEKRLVKLCPIKSSITESDIISVCSFGTRSDALACLKPDSFRWYDTIFALKNNDTI